jgi:hypothetical protein
MFRTSAACAAQHLVALRFRLLGQGQLCGHFTILAILPIPLEGYRDAERDHVGIGRAALAVDELHGHVGCLPACASLASVARDLDLLASVASSGWSASSLSRSWPLN